MRARRGVIAGGTGVVLLAAAMVAVTVTTPHGVVRGERRTDRGAAAELIVAWERSRTATFVRSGTYERRSDVSGATIASDDVLAQDPPRRLHRQLGGIDGQDDDREIVCPAPIEGAPDPACHLGKPGGPTYAEAVAEEIDGLHSILDGRSPLYAVKQGRQAGCFDLAQLRADPRAPFGVQARFCFDVATGAPTSSRVRYPAGITEVIVATDLRADVTDADLRP